MQTAYYKRSFITDKENSIEYYRIVFKKYAISLNI